MGKIFGISDLPVSTIDKALAGYHYKQPNSQVVRKIEPKFVEKNVGEVSGKFSKTFINMRNGFGKLMSHFSKKLVK